MRFATSPGWSIARRAGLLTATGTQARTVPLSTLLISTIPHMPNMHHTMVSPHPRSGGAGGGRLASAARGGGGFGGRLRHGAARSAGAAVDALLLLEQWARRLDVLVHTLAKGVAELG